MPRYRKKPVEIDADEWIVNGDHPDDYKDSIIDYSSEQKPRYTPEYQKEHNWEGQVVRYFRHPNVLGSTNCQHCNKIMHVHGWIDTLEGGHIVCPYDMIITGVEGERYPCKPEIFSKTYDKVEDDIVLSDAVIKSLNDLKEMSKGIDDVLIDRWDEVDPNQLRLDLGLDPKTFEEFNGPDSDNV